MAELVDRGYEVDWAATGIEGLDKARAGEADVMIVDRLLPGMDGLTIIEAVRTGAASAPRSSCSARSEGLTIGCAACARAATTI